VRKKQIRSDGCRVVREYIVERINNEKKVKLKTEGGTQREKDPDEKR